MRSSIATLLSPNNPISNVVIQTMASAIMNWAAVTNRRLHRAAIHNNIGKIETRATSSHGAPGMKIKSELAAAKINRAAVPSTDFLRDGGSRAMVMRPITNGATAMIPMASDPNQWYQIVRADVADWWNNK